MEPITNVALAGIGEFFARYGGVNGTSAPFMIGFLQDAQIGIEASTQKLFGGSGKFPLATATIEKTITITAKQAVVSMDTIRLTQGEVLTDTGEHIPRLAARETVTLGATGASGVTLNVSSLAYGTDYIWNENIVIEYADGTGRLTSTTATNLSATGSSGEFVEVSGSSLIRFWNDDAGKRVTISYLYNYDIDASGVADGVVATVLDNSTVGCPFELHYTKMFEECDNAYGLEALFYAVQPAGKYTLPMSRGDFTQPDVEFEAVDPKRSDGRVGILLLRNEVS